MDNITPAEAVQASALRHIAFIMDGNGRWATERMLPREAGHKAGADNFKTIVRYCKKIGIRVCTVYAFSTENWKRPKREVEAILRLLTSFVKEAEDEVGTTMRFIGDVDGLPPKLVSDMRRLEAETAGNPYVLQIALNYGGRADIVHAVNALLAEGKTSVTENDINAHLYTAGQPDPDLIVRTAGEMRLSNFLLWQCAYAELYYTNKYWPAMTTADVDEAVYNFAHRKRRFGGLDKPDSVKKENLL
ncbi:MAG: polyprenyl diphosphate synthase [Eubacteriales bacterium]|nr:polyprenyl diphosphate synthase [Clostridiales bacterium]MDD7773540.1 polyprenyl diphosphate synthase [Eubacteriales bacterium]MDY3941947.1 polyprenyl diphosphate synthase [Eubacteriales bacterium]